MEEPPAPRAVHRLVGTRKEGPTSSNAFVFVHFVCFVVSPTASLPQICIRPMDVMQLAGHLD
jgi:hypothetical protein